MDVGGKTPGSMPVQATTIFEEGMRLPPVKLYKEGEFDSELLETFAHNTRLPEHAEADIKALAAGTAAAEAFACRNSVTASGRRPTWRGATPSSTVPATE